MDRGIEFQRFANAKDSKIAPVNITTTIFTRSSGSAARNITFLPGEQYWRDSLFTNVFRSAHWQDDGRADQEYAS